MAGREGMPQTSFRTIAVLTLLPILGLFAFVLFRAVYPKVEKVKALTRRSAPPSPASGRGHSQLVTAAVVAKKPVGSIVLILDDFGFEGQPIERAMRLDPDINFAILPNGNRTTDFA